MATEIDGNEPVPKLTTKLRSEIMPPEPFEYTVLKPAEPIIENNEESSKGLEPTRTINKPEVEERFEESRKTLKIPRHTASKSKGIRKTDDASLPKLHTELRKHSDARKKAEREILNIKKELKDLLLVHHATIKDLQKQITQMNRKIATIDSSEKSTQYKTTNKKAAPKKTIISKRPKKKTFQKKIRKR